MLRPITLTALFVLCPLAAVAQDGGLFTVVNTNDTGPGSLREAVVAANARPGADTVRFNIPGTGPHLIRVASALPEITDPLTVDGSTQPGSEDAPAVELRAIGDVEYGLRFMNARGVVRRLAVGGFSRIGLHFEHSHGSVVEGCHVGVDAGGTRPVPNRAGIGIDLCAGVRIGGSAPGARNVISANGPVTAKGSPFLSGGICIRFGSAGTSVIGNYIGTDAGGSAPLGNAGRGVNNEATHSLTVGGTAPGEGNVIAYNTGEGVFGEYGIGQHVLSNSIYENGSPSAPADAHTGINYEQAWATPWPTITYVGREGAETRVRGGVRRRSATATMRVELFRNPAGCGGPGRGQGRELVAGFDVAPNEDGIYLFSALVPVALAAGDTITGTTSILSEYGHTSLFSECVGDTGGCEAPFVTDAPDRPVTVARGGRATLHVAATGTSTRFQWLAGDEDGSPIAGATGDTLVTPPLQSDAVYTARITGACGAVTEETDVYVCEAAPTIVLGPASQTVLEGNPIELVVRTADERTRRFLYEWFAGEPGDTSRPLASGVNYSYYSAVFTETTTVWVRISDACGSDQAAATITVTPRVHIETVTFKKNKAGATVIVIGGRYLEPGSTVRLEAGAFAKPAKLKKGMLKQSGALENGATIDAAFPAGTSGYVAVFTPGHGSNSILVTRP